VYTFWKNIEKVVLLLVQGELSEGKLIAVKQLSAKSRQGNREFVNEIGMISALQHPNLVKLYGCCVEGNQLILVYEYLENNCLSRALFGMLFLSNLHLRNYPVELLLRIFVWVIFFCRKG
jgi:serine/threonine protein kinase